MQPQQVDRLIKQGKPVTVRYRFGKPFTLVLTHRDEWNVYGVITEHSDESFFGEEPTVLAFIDLS